MFFCGAHCAVRINMRYCKRNIDNLKEKMYNVFIIKIFELY